MSRARKLLHARAKRRGATCCADGSCIYGHPGGMATNGGCAALKESDATVLRRHVQQLRAIALELATELINDRDGRWRHDDTRKGGEE